MAGGGTAFQQDHHLRRRQAKASTDVPSGLPSEDLGFGQGDSGAAMKLGRVHGYTVALCSDEASIGLRLLP